MIILVVLILLAIIGIASFLKSPKFGSLPKDARRAKIIASPNYKQGKFQNSSATPDFTDGATLYSVLKDFMFRRSKQAKPPAKLPSVKTDLLHLNLEENILVWFGHSSYFMQVDGKTILVDPVFSGNASPLSFTTKSFPGSDVYAPEDFPPIDFLFISHDHWDHMDYKTLQKLKPKIKHIITGLGTAAHLERWHFDPAIIHEKDWNETIQFGNGFTVHTTPGRHFSGRGIKRQQSLWLSFVLQTPTMKLFLGGDSGYDTHFAEIGARFGPFDLAILECGQYNKSWKHIHMMPEEVITAAKALKAKTILPVHWGKFMLSLHAWDEPVNRVVAAAKANNVPLIHPMIGEKVNLEKPGSPIQWWKTGIGPGIKT